MGMAEGWVRFPECKRDACTTGRTQAGRAVPRGRASGTLALLSGELSLVDLTRSAVM